MKADLAEAQAELASLNTTLKHTPVIVDFRGKDYVRVVPDSETGFTRKDGTDAPGHYARVWPVR